MRRTTRVSAQRLLRRQWFATSWLQLPVAANPPNGSFSLPEHSNKRPVGH